MRGRVSRFSAEQIKMIVRAVAEHGSVEAPRHLPFEITGQLCMYYFRKANPEAPIHRRSPRKPKVVVAQ